MALAFSMSAQAVEIFFSTCHELKADTEEERVRILLSMAKLGLLQNVIETNKTKEEYIADLKRNFKVADLTSPTYKLGENENGRNERRSE